MWIIVVLILIVVGIIVSAVMFETFRNVLLGITGLIILLIIRSVLNKNKDIEKHYKLFGKEAVKVLTNETISCRKSGDIMDGKETIVGNMKFIYVHRFERFFPESDYKLIIDHINKSKSSNHVDVTCNYRDVTCNLKEAYGTYNTKDFNRLVEETEYCADVSFCLDGKEIEVNGTRYKYYHERHRYYTIDEYNLIMDNNKKKEEEKKRRREEEFARSERSRKSTKKSGGTSYGGTSSGGALEENCKILGIDPSMVKDKEFLKVAYRARLKKIHPDAGGSEEESKRVNIAYEYLNNL